MENGANFSVYCPTEFYDWMSSTDKKFQEQQLRHIDDLQQILVPVYMLNHWELVFVNLVNRKLCFDDGMKFAPPPLTLASVQQLLALPLEMYPWNTALQSRFWQSCQRLQCFGMPSQIPVNSKGIRVGGCGIGVVMAPKDIILNGSMSINNFQWRYCDMDTHRKHLMLQILNWRVQS